MWQWIKDHSPANVALIAAFGIGVFVGCSIQRSVWKKEAVKRGMACYDTKTGYWRWLKDVELEEKENAK